MDKPVEEMTIGEAFLELFGTLEGRQLQLVSHIVETTQKKKGNA